MVEIEEKDVKKAYKVACSDAKKVLRALFPAIFSQGEPKTGAYKGPNGEEYFLTIDGDGDYRLSDTAGVFEEDEDGENYFTSDTFKEFMEKHQLKKL